LCTFATGLETSVIPLILPAENLILSMSHRRFYFLHDLKSPFPYSFSLLFISY